MYDEHYGLSGRPFQLTPDARFWFETATHRKAMAYLGYGLAQGEGFIVITGDIGAGKTTLVGHLMDTIDHQRLNVVKLVSTAIEAEDLLRIVATELGIDPAGLEKAQLLVAIERGLHGVARTGKRTLLIVDEAQALPVSALEELRMLSNFQAGGHALLQIVLLGQPEFRDRLHGSDRLEQLRQRVIAIHHLDPMEEHEVADYIAHRLGIVGWQGNPDFADDAFPALYRGSGGVPRRLNLLAGRVMLHAAVDDLRLIDARVVRAVLRDLSADLPMLSLDTGEKTPIAADEPRATAPMAFAPIGCPVAIEPEAPVPIKVSVAPDPMPMRMSRWLDAAPTPSTIEPAPPVVAEPEIAESAMEEPAPEPEPVAPAEPAEPAAVEPEPASSSASAETRVVDPAIEARIAMLESRIEQQDEALRRVLILLVDWVESDAAKPDHVPIRGVTKWHDAA